MGRYRKKPVVVEAVIWDGSNSEECIALYPARIELFRDDEGLLSVETTTGGHIFVHMGFVLIRDHHGSLWAENPETFKSYYEPIIQTNQRLLAHLECPQRHDGVSDCRCDELYERDALAKTDEPDAVGERMAFLAGWGYGRMRTLGVEEAKPLAAYADWLKSKETTG